MRQLIRYLILIAVFACFIAVVFGIPAAAEHAYGAPSPRLSSLQVIEYSLRLMWDDGLLTHPMQPDGPQQSFSVQSGESVSSVSERLQAAGLISEAGMLRDYLVYTGLDSSIQAGDYQLSPAMSIVDIARKMQDATPEQVPFVVLPGWRMEEIAASLPTSGLNITPQEFLAAAGKPQPDFEDLADASTAEGFLFPDTYILPRSISAQDLVNAMLRNSALHLTRAMRDGFERQGLSVYQAVILASIVERETVHPEEAAQIASVYLNRLKIGMKLDADPTVQYAMGFNASLQTWWTSPLSAVDLQTSSPFNTYLIDGLPPTPIANPGISSLQAVAEPAETGFFYFSARCDGSGFHNFAQTFQEHLQNLCP